jgi:hypothetical protein
VITAAIDPGVQGAVAFLDTATGQAWGETLDTGDATALAELLRAQAPARVAVEVPVGRPPQTGGYAQISRQWRAIGCAEGVVLALGLPLVRVQPREWQRAAFAGQAKPASYAERKRLSLRLARERWPGAHLARAKDSGLADALWIACAVARCEAGEPRA